MTGYGNHLSQVGKDAADLREQQIAEVKEYLQQNPNDLEAIAQECAESPEYLSILINMENIPVTKVIAIHNAMQTVKKRKSQTQISPEKLQEIIEFIKPNTTVIFDLAELSGISAVEIANIFQNKSGEAQSVTCLYNAIQQIRDMKATPNGKQL